MICRWISLVPSQMRSTRASRQMRSSGRSSIRPMPPWIWIASSAMKASTSVAFSLAIAMSSSVTVPWSYFQAASRVSSSAAFSSIAMSASLNDTPWNLPICWPNCSRCAAYSIECCSARSARPRQVEATCSRVAPSQELATSKPLWTSPSTWLLRQAAVVEFEDRVGVAAMRDVAVAVAHGEARRALVDEEGGDLLALAARRLFLAGRHEADGEVGDVGMADEVLRAVEDEVVAVLHGSSPSCRAGPSRRPARSWRGSPTSRRGCRDRDTSRAAPACRQAGCWTGAPRRSSAARSWRGRVPSRRAARSRVSRPAPPTSSGMLAA